MQLIRAFIRFYTGLELGKEIRVVRFFLPASGLILGIDKRRLPEGLGYELQIHLPRPFFHEHFSHVPVVGLPLIQRLPSDLLTFRLKILKLPQSASVGDLSKIQSIL